MTRARVATVGALLLASLLLVRGLATSPPPARGADLRWLCGSERWPVKTFSDADKAKVNLTVRYRTIKQLNMLVRPSPRPQNGRAAGELNVYRVTATVTAAINEDDGDIHLALMGTDGSTLIAEAPEPGCDASARDRTQINKARLAAQNIQVSDKVVATGVGFFDFAHHQTGHATNYIELHPLLSLRKL